MDQATYWRAVEAFDTYLDEGTSDDYKDQPLAQDWARVSKLVEEVGESIAELILHTGQNPRKPRESDAFDRLLDELADVILTGTYGLQHFTKDAAETRRRIEERLVYHGERVGLWAS